MQIADTLICRRQIAEVPNPGELYSELMDLIVRLARAGLIHGDFNEFNILIREVTSEDGTIKASPILIDFPQMVSVNHENAEYYFNRDVECIRTFFKKRFRYESSIYPRFISTMKEGIKDFELDVVVAASGFGKKEGEELERYMKMVKEAEEHEDRDDEEDEDSDVEEEFEEEDDDEEEEEAHASTSEPKTPSSDHELAEGLEEAELESEGDEDPSGEEEELSEEEGESQSIAANTNRKRSAKAVTPSAKDVQNIVATSLQRQDRNQTRKHHGKKGVTSAGRAKGSKKKTDAKNAIRNSGDF
jgi:RIO kinase 2